MKGIIFNVLSDSVASSFGDDAWDDVLDKAGVEGAYTSLGNYSDTELRSIVGALPEICGSNVADRLRWVGRTAIPFLAETFPQFFDDTDLFGFLPNLNHIIHPEVRKLYPGATPPDFDIGSSDDALLLTYRSDRKLCWLAEGFVQGTALHFAETVTVSQPRCMHTGHDCCDILVRRQAGV